MNNTHKNSDIYDLATKKLSGEITISEELALNELLSLDENRKIFDDLNKIWNSSAPSINVDTISAWKKLNNKIELEETPVIQIAPSRSFQWMSIAASILLVFGIFILYKFNNTSTNTQHLAVVTEHIQLADNSLVDLKKGSTLSYPQNFNEKIREVNLKGEAFFNIKRNEDKPFIIHTNSVNVKVLGTSFFVHTKDNDDVEVIVKKGKVKVSNILGDTNSVTLKASESIIFIKASNTFKVIKEEKNKLYWQTKTLIFNRTTLEYVVDLINHNFNTKVIIKNEKIKNCKLTVTFKNQSIDEIIEIIKETLNISSTMENGIIILDGDDCQ